MKILIKLIKPTSSNGLTVAKADAEFCGVAYTPHKEEDKPSSLQIVLEDPGGLKTEHVDADHLEGAPGFVQQDNIDGHYHRPEARTRRLADPPDPELCGEQSRVADLVA
jgi:hypothetical protein